MGGSGRKQDGFSSRPFEKLKKRIKHHEAASAPSTARTGPPAPTDEDLFTAAMNGVHAIDEFRFLPCANSPRRASVDRPDDPDLDALEILTQIARGDQPINLSDTQEYVEWTNPGVTADVTKELHAGRFSIQGMLDLHGFTGDAVNEELDDFLARAFQRGWRCVKIIHGRGLRSVRGPVLKDAVIKRLLGRYRKELIAFVSARQCDGGLGALYVLLR